MKQLKEASPQRIKLDSVPEMGGSSLCVKRSTWTKIIHTKLSIISISFRGKTCFYKMVLFNLYQLLLMEYGQYDRNTSMNTESKIQKQKLFSQKVEMPCCC